MMPTFHGLFATTRAMCWPKAKQRRAVGWTLLLIGAATTVPLAVQVMSRRRALKAAAAGAEQPEATAG